MLALQGGERREGALPAVGLGVGAVDVGTQPGAFGCDVLDVGVDGGRCDKSGNGFARRPGRVLEPAICAVPFDRGSELLARLFDVGRDGVEQVGLAAARQADIDAGSVQAQTRRRRWSGC